MKEKVSPLSGVNTFHKAQYRISDTHTAIKNNNPMKLAVKHVKSKVYPNFSHTYSIPKGW